MVIAPGTQNPAATYGLLRNAVRRADELFARDGG
jgi:hypothetical protein